MAHNLNRGATQDCFPKLEEFVHEHPDVLKLRKWSKKLRYRSVIDRIFCTYFEEHIPNCKAHYYGNEKGPKLSEIISSKKQSLYEEIIITRLRAMQQNHAKVQLYR